MRYLPSFLVLAAAAFFSCSGNDQTAGPSGQQKDSLARVKMADTSSYTSIEWIDSTHQDLGKVARGGVQEISWRFRNTGNTPLVFQTVSAGCGCTVADKPEEPIMPNGEGRIVARFDSKSQHIGENRKDVTAIANTKGQSVHRLSFAIHLTDK
ncbi:MAG TPA: DUF1573 domain-containing protein [Flavisolibacter sp.]|nr:DUF1573 domain-containing protein [Flavisolibacter sp.]